MQENETFIEKEANIIFENKEELELFFKTIQLKRDEINGIIDNANDEMENILKEYFDK